MSSFAPQKELQRKAGISARMSLPKEMALEFSKIISRRLTRHPEYKHAKIIFSYSPFGGEVDVCPFNEHSRRNGKSVAFPICHKNGRMVAAVPMDEEAWETGKYGIRAPVESRSRILEPTEIDMVIVPCTAFSGRRKMRLGMGAGYYDRYLPQCKKAIGVAVAFEVQHIENICSEEWDMPLDSIVTEKNWY